jgi:hypothetical protein
VPTIRAAGLAVPRGQQVFGFDLAFDVNGRRHVARIGIARVEHFVGDGEGLVVDGVHPAGLNVLGLHPVLQRPIGNYAVELPVPVGRFQQIAVRAAVHLQAVVSTVLHLLGRDIDAHRTGASFPRQFQQVAVTASNLQQPKARPVAADLVEKVVQLPLDSLFQRRVGRPKLAIGQIADSHRLGGMHERVTEFDQPCACDTRLVGCPELPQYLARQAPERGQVSVVYTKLLLSNKAGSNVLLTWL